MKKNACLLVLLMIWAPFLKSYANIKLPAIITDHMVLQQQSNVILWGWATPNERIEVNCSWQKKTIITTADAKGDWKVQVTTVKAGGPYILKFKGKNLLSVADVYLGEVWLASGQSNMEWSVGRVKSADSVINAANYPFIRMFNVTKGASPFLKNDVTGSWSVSNPQNVGKFSAVAYYFGIELANKLKVPIGLIHSSWGGTPAESWVKKEVLESREIYKPILERYEASIARYDAEKSAAAGKEIKNTDPRTRFNSPAVLYNVMINPLINYKIKGVIWYQGEANAGRAYQYRQLFPALIESWRKCFNNKEMPFYYVQIAPFKSQIPEIREAQLLSLKASKNVGMVVTTDVGDCEDIHPKDKETVGKRLSYIALNRTYRFKEIEYLSPMYKHLRIDKDSIRIFFDTKSPLMATSELRQFVIAGEDQVFYPANAKISNTSVIVFSEKVKNPVAVRYGWENCPEGFLFNKAKLPASPFRTDSWKENTEGKN